MSNRHECWLRIQMDAGPEQTITLTPRASRFRGHQWYFVCPVEIRCCSVLWMPPGANHFRWRQGWGRRVAYTSQFLDPDNRAHRGQAKIKAKLIADLDPDEWELPPKPKWMQQVPTAAPIAKHRALLLRLPSIRRPRSRLDRAQRTALPENQETASAKSLQELATRRFLRNRARRLLAMRHTPQLQGQREAPVGQLSRSYRGEENGEVEVTGIGQGEHD
jgi:hypothetical protein